LEPRSAPLWALRSRSAQHDAKICDFNARVRELKKLAHIAEQKLLLSTSAARVVKMASDALQIFISFSSFALQSGNAKGDPRGNVLARFLGYFFDVRQRSNTTAQRAALWRAHPATEKISLSIQGVPP